MLSQLKIEWTGFTVGRQLRSGQTRIKELQNQLVFEIAQKQQRTAFGLQHGFNRVYDVNSYRRRVPVQTNDNLLPYYRGICRGRNGLLTTEDNVGLLVGNNRHQPARYLPVTESLLKQYERVVSVWLYTAIKQFPNLLGGNWGHVNFDEKHVAVSSMKSLGIARRLFFKSDRPTSNRLCFMTLIEDENIRLISASSISDLTELLRRLEDIQFEYIAALINGGSIIVDGMSIDIKRNRDRARRLQASLERRGYLMLSDIWPQLQLAAIPLNDENYDQIVYMHLQIADHIPVKNFNCDLFSMYWGFSQSLYSANFNFLVRDVFIEFETLDCNSEKTGDIALMSELEAGNRYNVVVTTSHGLYRYDTGRTVEAVSAGAHLPDMRFVGTSSLSDIRYVRIAGNDEQRLELAGAFASELN